MKCLYCGASFEYDKYRSNRKFCNENCRKKYYGIKEKTYEIKKCEHCGKEFECSSSTPNKKFCSRECLRAQYKEQAKSNQTENIKKVRKCAYCGKQFVWESSKSNQIFCTSVCQKKSTYERIHKAVITEKRKCQLCGEEFEWYSTKPNQKYCSKECLKLATANNIKLKQKGSEEFLENLRSTVYLKVAEIISKMQDKGETFNNQYIDYWKVGDISEKTREQVLKRDNYECQVCKRKDSLHLHHLIKRKDGGTHDAENLITLCASCHRHIETGDLEHASQKCFKNAKEYYNLGEVNEEVEMAYISSLLKNYFEEIEEKMGEQTELLVKLDNIIEIIDSNI